MKHLFNARINVPLFKHTFKKYRSLLVVFTLLLAITFPIPLTISHFFYYNVSQIDYNYAFSYVLMLLFLTVCILIVMPFIVFNYLKAKRSVDVYHSLPVRRNDLFLTNFLFSFLIVVIPFSISYWLGYSALDMFSVNFSMSREILFVYIRLLLMFFTIQAPIFFVIMNTGTTSDSIIYSMLVMISPFVAFGAFFLFFSSFISGFNPNSANMSIFYLSPIAALFTLFRDSYFAQNVDANVITSYWTLLSLILSAVSCRLYRCFKSENSESPFVNTFFYPAIISLFTFLLIVFLFSIFASVRDSFSLSDLIIPFLFCFVFYAILDIIKNRSFKEFGKTILNYIIIFALTLAIVTPLYLTQGFGYGYHVPSIENVKEAELKIFASSSANPLLSNNDSYGYNGQFIFEDEESLNELIAFHQYLVDAVKADRSAFDYDDTSYDGTSYYTPTTTIELSYTMNSGSSMNRAYTIRQEHLEKLYTILNNESFARQKQPILNLDVNPQMIHSFTLYNATLTETYRTGDLQNEELAEAYLNDLDALSEENYLYDESTLHYVIAYQIYAGDGFEPGYQLFVDSRFPETLALLEKHRTSATSTNLEYEKVSASQFISQNDDLLQYALYPLFGVIKPFNVEPPFLTSAIYKDTNYDVSEDLGYDFTSLSQEETRELMLYGNFISDSRHDVLIAHDPGNIYISVYIAIQE